MTWNFKSSEWPNNSYWFISCGRFSNKEPQVNMRGDLTIPMIHIQLNNELWIYPMKQLDSYFMKQNILRKYELSQKARDPGVRYFLHLSLLSIFLDFLTFCRKIWNMAPFKTAKKLKRRSCHSLIQLLRAIL